MVLPKPLGILKLGGKIATEDSLKLPSTEKPAVNCLANAEYALLLDAYLGGYSLIADGTVLTRADEQLPLNHRPGRAIYLRDHDTQAVWAVTSPTEAFSAITPALGYSQLSTQWSGLTLSGRVFVPVIDPVELWDLTLTNNDRKKRRLSLYFVLEWSPIFDGCRSTDGGLIARSRAASDLAAWLAFDRQPDSLETDRRRFFGAGGYAWPMALIDGRLSRKLSSGDLPPIAVLERKITLGSHAGANLGVTVGGCRHVRAADRARALIKRYAKGETRQAAFERVVKSVEMASFHRVNSPDATFNRTYNTVAPYQAQLADNMPRLGGWGRRPDDAQLTSVAYCAHLINRIPESPSDAEMRLAKLLSGQLSDGVVPMSWPPGQNAVSSSPAAAIALVEAVCRFIAETGRLDYLKTHHDYLDGGSGTCIEHLNRAVRYLQEERGQSGLLDRGEESVVTTGQWVNVLQQLVPLLNAFGEHQHAERLSALAVELHRAISRRWTGRSFERSLTPRRLGSPRAKYHQVDLAAQTWAILAGAAAEQGAKALKTVRDQLWTQAGVVNLAPPYPYYSADNPFSWPPPGQGENGGVNYAENLDLARAMAAVGDGEGLARLLSVLSPWLPTWLDADGKPTILFGSPVAGNYRRVVMENLAGITPVIGGLKIDPCLPRDWRLLEINRVFRGAEYHIRIHNPLRVNRGVDRIIVDGERLTGRVIRPFTAGSHLVEVFLG